MIYTVTLNPALDYIVSVQDFEVGKTNRTSEELMLPGGKGINVSTVLSNLQIPNTALGFVAGFTGEELVRRVQERGIENGLIVLEEGQTRINVKLKSIDGTEINGMGPVISQEALLGLMEQLKTLKEGDYLCLSGSIPASMPKDFYQKMMSELEGKGILVCVDATKEALLPVLKHHPFLIKPNQYELEEIFDLSFDSKESVIPYGKKLTEMGAEQVLISMGNQGAVLVCADGRVYLSDAPEGQLINSVGAGDSMIAGFLAGWISKKNTKEAFAMAVSAGSASAYSEQLAGKEEIKALYAKVSAKIKEK